MDWNRNGKRDPADDIIDRKLSEAGKEPAESPSARPRAAHLRFDIWLPLIYPRFAAAGRYPDQQLYDGHRADLRRSPCMEIP